MDRSLLRRYAASGVLIAGLYLLNRFLLIPLTGWRLPAWHGADFLAGGAMLCFLNGLLLLARRRPVERIFPASLFLLGCGLTVENNAVDLLCVGIGVCLYRTVRDNFAEARLGSGLARE